MSNILHACPACWFKSLTSYADFAICHVCWWEDDPSQAALPWSWMWPNHGTSLVEWHEKTLEKIPPSVLSIESEGIVYTRSPNWLSIYEKFIDSRPKNSKAPTFGEYGSYFQNFIYSFDDTEDVSKPLENDF